MSDKISLDAPNLGTIEKEYLNKAVDSGFVSTVGPFVDEFESVFSGYLNTKKAVSIQSGTAAIFLALKELGIGEGDEVIVPVLTFVATVNPIIQVGAKPVFIDVDINTWNLNPAEIKKVITSKTKAILPVHLYGNPCDLRPILEIAKKHNLYVIEDVTESLGATYKGKFTGTFGDFGCFSFNGNKIITTGGGGMIVGKNKRKLNHIKFLINQAKQTLNGAYYHPEIGYNYRMTNIEAAIGLAQMKRLRKFLAQKRKFNKIYLEKLGKIDGVFFQEEYEGSESSYWLNGILFERTKDISVLQSVLAKKNIPVRRVFMPIVEFPPYKKFNNGNYNNAYHIYEKGLCLPSSTLNSEYDIRYVCRILNGALY